MPGYRQHLFYATIWYTALLFLFFLCTASALPIFEWGLCMLAGALFPDIDIKSKGQIVFFNLFLITGGLLILLRQWYVVSILLVISYLPLLARHRTVFHNFWIILGGAFVLCKSLSICVPCYSCRIYCDMFFFMIGVLSHLVLDKGIFKALRLP